MTVIIAWVKASINKKFSWFPRAAWEPGEFQVRFGGEEFADDEGLVWPHRKRLAE